MRPDRVLGLLLVLALAAGTAHGLAIEVSEPYPLRGVPATLSLSGDGAEAARSILVTYRPNSQTSHEETLELAGSSVEWTPRDAGIVQLSVRGADGATITSRNVAVRFGGFPASGLAVMLVAATILFGGAIFAFLALLREPALPPEEEVEPPST